ncbi:psbP domain-containing protein 5, chloroplastic-like isoform X1 [Coffea arabica]|uniref:PsbP domain-containing protein 5, chloroplastic-like isoform X1 n=1 Tax=Coffea arabica TaxID=13443 RepID=A0ABM4VDB6_COFAR
MVAVLPSPLLTSNHHFLLPSLTFFRNQSGIFSRQRKYKLDGKIMASSSSSSNPTSQNGIFCRRNLMLTGFSTSLSLILPFSTGSDAEEEVKMAHLIDDINAYSYSYPLGLPSKKLAFKWVESRKPERYSSAAPLSPDARLRIVSERVDFIDNLVISVSIGPPNAQILKSNEKSAWSAKDVADSVLADKSSLRVTSTQRLAESSVLDAHSSEVDGVPYWYYEYIVRKSPTKIALEPNLFRHYVASTAERDGYLYSLSASTLSKQWNDMGPLLQKTVASFRLLPPTENYVPPYKDPWRFW